MRQALEQATTDLSGVSFSGPAPAPLERVENHYRFQILVRVHRMQRLSVCMAEVLQSLRLPEGVKVSVDIDPVNLC